MPKDKLYTNKELKLISGFEPIFNDKQLEIINQVTPDEEIEVKTDDSGFAYKSVKASYIKTLVTMVTGGNYNFEIKSREFIQGSREVLIEGRLTIVLNGKSYFREQFGQHYLTQRTISNENTKVTFTADIGNGYKAAASDCFKKCASEFGFCWDIYRQEAVEIKNKESPELSYQDVKKLERLSLFLQRSATTEELENAYNTYLETAEETNESKDLYNDFLKKFN